MTIIVRLLVLWEKIRYYFSQDKDGREQLDRNVH